MFLPFASVASVCSLHEDSWKLKVSELVTLGSLTLDGCGVLGSLQLSCGCVPQDCGDLESLKLSCGCVPRD